jgi:hypothetical protein
MSGHGRYEMQNFDAKGTTNLSFATMPPATAIDKAQLPRMMLYWCRDPQSAILSFVLRAFHRASSSAASLSSSMRPAPVLRDVSVLP